MTDLHAWVKNPPYRLFALSGALEPVCVVIRSRHIVVVHDLGKFPTLAAKVIEDRSLEGILASIHWKIVSRQTHLPDECQGRVAPHDLPLVVPLKAVIAGKEDSILPLGSCTRTGIRSDQESEREQHPGDACAD